MSTSSLSVPTRVKRGLSQSEGSTTPLDESVKRQTASFSSIPNTVFDEEAEKDDNDYPFDFEKYYESREVQREPVAELVKVPGDALLVSAPTRVHRSTPAPPSLWKEGQSKYIDDCISFYTKKQWSRVQRKYFPAIQAANEPLDHAMIVEMYQHNKRDMETNTNGGLMFRVKGSSDGVRNGDGSPDEPDSLYPEYLGLYSI